MVSHSVQVHCQLIFFNLNSYLWHLVYVSWQLAHLYKYWTKDGTPERVIWQWPIPDECDINIAVHLPCVGKGYARNRYKQIAYSRLRLASQSYVHLVNGIIISLPFTTQKETTSFVSYFNSTKSSIPVMKSSWLHSATDSSCSSLHEAVEILTRYFIEFHA
jgi:hypothetical protein